MTFDEIKWDIIKKEAKVYVKLRKVIIEDFLQYGEIQDSSWYLYKRFYKLYNRKPDWYDNYRKLFNTNIKEKSTDLEKLIRQINTDSVEVSFASKLIHTIDDSKPIYDSYVRKALSLGDVIGDDYDIKVRQALILYNRIDNFYISSDTKKIRDRIIKEFDRRNIIDSEISKTKKIDFVLWAVGKTNRMIWELE